jgi:hypothetical protein
VNGAYPDLFAAIAAASGTLTGLLFVALSVTPSRRAARSGSPVIQQLRAAAALQLRQLELVVVLLLIFGTELIALPTGRASTKADIGSSRPFAVV